MQSSFRDYLNNQNEDNEDEESGSSAKAKLMKTFTDRENQLMEDLGVQKAENENLREKLKKMRTYARKARNIALDYYPPNEELPEMLTKDLEAFFQDAENLGLTKDQVDEMVAKLNSLTPRQFTRMFEEDADISYIFNYYNSLTDEAGCARFWKNPSRTRIP